MVNNIKRFCCLQDCSLDGLERAARERGTRTAAEGIVHDLTTLGVADENDLGVRAALVQARDGRHYGGRSLLGGLVVLGRQSAGVNGNELGSGDGGNAH